MWYYRCLYHSTLRFSGFPRTNGQINPAINENVIIQDSCNGNFLRGKFQPTQGICWTSLIAKRMLRTVDVHCLYFFSPRRRTRATIEIALFAWIFLWMTAPLNPKLSGKTRHFFACVPTPWDFSSGNSFDLCRKNSFSGKVLSSQV